MERRVEKIQNRMAKDPIQMVTQGVAYDFRNLLDAIRSMAITARSLAKSPNRAQYLMRQIVQVVDQNSRVVDLLDQFADTRKCQKQVVDLNRVAEMLCDHEKHHMPNVVLAFDLLDQPIPVAVDAEKICQAAGALLDNAYQAVSETKGRIIVSTDIVCMANGSCEFYGLPAGEYARLTVTDNGLGMEKDVLTQVFTPFYTTKECSCSERKGLGLTLAGNIVDSHGGTIDIWSTPGSGSAFSINLPLENQAMEQDLSGFWGTSFSGTHR